MNVTASNDTLPHTWAELRKAWKAYKVAKLNEKVLLMREYERKINKLQTDLHVPQTRFDV